MTVNFICILIIFSGVHVFAKEAVPGFKRDPASVVGTSEVAIQNEFSWIKIEGSSAKALYDTLTVPAKNNQGEAGPNLYFKLGKSYRCYSDKQTSNYACDIMVENPRTGQIK